MSLIPVLKIKTVFLIDAIGAILTATLLMAVVRTFNEYFGMPQQILVMLSVTALFLAMYSFYCFTFCHNTSQQLLIPLIIANLAYCMMTIAFVIYLYSVLTVLGVAYFLGESIVIVALVFIELQTLKRNR